MPLINVNVPPEAKAAAQNAKQITEAFKAASIAAAKAYLEVMEKPAGDFAMADEPNQCEQVA